MSIKILREAIIKRCDLLSKFIPELEKKLIGFPEGRLKTTRRGDVVNYYLVNCPDGNTRMLKKSEHGIAKQLAQKAYFQRVLRIAGQEQETLKVILTKLPETVMEDVYDQLPQDRKDLVKPIVLPDSEFSKRWQEEPYIGKLIDENTPFFETLKKERVRSKSEQIIADRLYLNNIPYKYECPLKLGKKTVHPDFTILRMSDRKELYYEHLGMMDDEGYANRNVKKVNEYTKNGFMPGIDLFLSMETSKVPLDTGIIDRMINESFR
ncbi:MAG: hypothetical protein J5685_01445 [Clostridiales bacterium]|nr:hypothetical protein [Clostridiales bacterium]